MLELIKSLIHLKKNKEKFEKSNVDIKNINVKPSCTPSLISLYIYNFINSYQAYKEAVSKQENNSKVLLITKSPYYDSVVIKVKTELGIRKLCCSTDSLTDYKLTYSDEEKILYQFREHRNSNNELFHVEMTYVDKDCHWTARKILDSVKEVRNILQNIIEDTREDNYNLAQELEQFRQDENIYVTE